MKLLFLFCLFSVVIFSQNTFSIEIGDNIHSQSPWSVIEVDDGYLISSDLNNATDFSIDLDIVLSKIDKKGNLLWEKIYQKDSTSEFYPYLVRTEKKDEFILGGSDIGKTYIKKIDSNGEIIWEKVLVAHRLMDLKVSENGDVYVLTQSLAVLGYSYGSTLVYKLNNKGEIVWQKNYENTHKEIIATLEIIDNYIYIYGYSDGEFSAKLYKLDFNGNIIYEKYNKSRYFYKTFKNDNNLYILTRDEKIYQILENGELELINSDFNSKRNFIRGFTLTSSKEYVLAYSWISRIGNEPYRVILLEKYDEEFNLLWSKEYFKGSIHNVRGVIETSDGGLLVFGFTYPKTGTFVLFDAVSILKMDCEGNLEWSSDACYNPKIIDLTIFPNPFQDILKIQIPNLKNTDNYSIVLHNKLGQKILFQKITSKITAINTKNLSRALYFYKIVNNNEVVEQGKVLKD